MTVLSVRSFLRLFSAFVPVIALVFIGAGCVSAPLRDARSAFFNGRPDDAFQTLADAKTLTNRDKLLFLMEKGLILHHAGRYEESISELRQAAGLIEDQETISVGEQAASLVTTEWITEYKGEYSERLWVHTYLMMNFLMLGQYEGALVEAKKSLKLLNTYPQPLKNDHFTRALIALCYENLNELSDAYIEYKKLDRQLNVPSATAWDLYRLANLLGFHDDAKKYKQRIPKEPVIFANGKPPAELVMFVALGRSPVKEPSNIVIPPTIRFSFPKYKASRAEIPQIRVDDTAPDMPVITITTDIGEIARASLDERGARMIAKETVRAGAKEAMARAVDKENELIGVVFRGILFVLEEPDTRSWETLPGSVTLLRAPLTPGRHNLLVRIYEQHGGLIEELRVPNLHVKPGERVFRSFRSTQ